MTIIMATIGWLYVIAFLLDFILHKLDHRRKHVVEIDYTRRVMAIFSVYVEFAMFIINKVMDRI